MHTLYNAAASYGYILYSVDVEVEIVSFGLKMSILTWFALYDTLFVSKFHTCYGTAILQNSPPMKHFCTL